MRQWTKFFGIGVLAAGMLVLPAPSVVDVPVEDGGPCLSVELGGSVSRADGPLNPDDVTGTLDSGALSCSGRPRNC